MHLSGRCRRCHRALKLNKVCHSLRSSVLSVSLSTHSTLNLLSFMGSALALCLCMCVCMCAYVCVCVCWKVFSISSQSSQSSSSHTQLPTPVACLIYAQTRPQIKLPPWHMAHLVSFDMAICLWSCKLINGPSPMTTTNKLVRLLICIIKIKIPFRIYFVSFSTFFPICFGSKLIID